MTRRPAAITQAEVARAIRAARQTGAEAIEVRPDGTIMVLLRTPPLVPTDDPFEIWERENESAKASRRRGRN
jgi:hypothetical protein